MLCRNACAVMLCRNACAVMLCRDAMPLCALVLPFVLLITVIAELLSECLDAAFDFFVAVANQSSNAAVLCCYTFSLDVIATADICP